jgi:DNA-binding winged helix-turn-helix (wHTH) protein
VLPEQPFQILRMLIEHAGDIVTRDEIQKKLWPNDTVVEFDASINAAINKLRQALGDSAAAPKYIATIARRGYRLLIVVETVAVGPALENGNVGVQPAPAVSPLVPSPAKGASLIGKKVSHYHGHRGRRNGSGV